MSLIRTIATSTGDRREAEEATRLLEQDVEATVVEGSGDSSLDRLGSYRIARRLGGGGMGVVYMAVDEGLERRAAVKVIRPEMAASREMIERLKLEAQAVARLSHPNIVSVYAFGTDRGLNYVAFEYVEGEDLAAVLDREGRLEPVRALRIVRQAAEGLRFALANNVIHRDVKPANILMLEGDMVKVADFGLAKRLDSESNVTRTASIVGSPSYMAPEQAIGNPVDFRADIYALGCTLFTCLVGKPPFSAENPLSILMKHATEPMPESAALKTMVGGRVVELLRRMMAKQPDSRFQSYGALIAAIDGIIEAASGKATVAQKPRKGFRRAYLVGAAPMLVLVLLMASLGLRDEPRPADGTSIGAPVPSASADAPNAASPASDAPNMMPMQFEAVARHAIAGHWKEAQTELRQLAEFAPQGSELRARLDAHAKVLADVEAFETRTIAAAGERLPVTVNLPGGRPVEIVSIDADGMEVVGPGGREVRQSWAEISPTMRGAIIDRVAGDLKPGTPDHEAFARVVDSMLTRLPNVPERWDYFMGLPRDHAPGAEWTDIWRDWTTATTMAWKRGKDTGDVRDVPAPVRTLLADRTRLGKRLANPDNQ